jgi:hypothetical protein
MPYDQYENVTAVVWREGYGETFRLVLKRREHMRPEAFTDDQIEVHFRGRDVSAFRKLTQRADAVLKAAKTAETARAANQRCQKYREKVAAHEHEKGKRLGREWRATAKETTIVEIENFGHRYKTENKVKLTGVAFSGLDNTWAANQEKRIGWPLVGFHISQEDELFQFCFVSEVKYDDLLLSLKRGARVDLYGFVFDMGMNGWHGFMCVLIDNEE